ncbi:hypothetical protein SFRURICE_001799 [Spodoptera frugiperda]|nr:hypothetical protein SFRURICE_001799 [Spodoptera frugiperda]
MEGAFVLPRFTIGIIEESMTLKRDIPYTRSLGSTTAFSSHEGPILHVPTGWYVVDVSCRSSALLTRVSVPLGKTTRIPLKVTWSCKFSPTARSFLTGMCNCSKCSRGPTPDNMSNFGELILPALTMTSFLAYAVCTLPFRVYLTPYATFCLFISTLVTSASDLTVKFFLLYLIGCMKALFVDTRTPSFDVDCEYIVVSLWAPLKSPRGTPPSTNALTIIMAGLSMLGYLDTYCSPSTPASQNKSAGVLRDVAHIVIAPPVVAEVCPFVVVLLAAADILAYRSCRGKGGCRRLVPYTGTNSGKSARPFLILEPVYYLGHPQDCPGRARQLLPSQSVSDDTPCGPGAYHYEVILLSRCHLIIVAVSSASLDPLVVRPSVELHHEATTRVSTSTPKRAYAAIAAKGGKQVQQGEKPHVDLHQEVPKKNQNDKEGFTLVERKKKRKPTCRNQCGTALTGHNHLLRPAVPATLLYVSRLHDSTKVEEIVEFIKIKAKLHLKVEQLHSQHRVDFKSFVVRVPD